MMKKIIIANTVLLLLTAVAVQAQKQMPGRDRYPMAKLAAKYPVKYTDGNDGWNADSLGNYRAVVRYKKGQFTKGKVYNGYLVRVVINWRRHDSAIDRKRIIVEDAQTHKRVPNLPVNLTNDNVGAVYFHAISGTGTYYVYYMPYKNEGRSNYPRGTYLLPDTTFTWQQQHAKGPNFFVDTATCTEIQYINTFNSPYPMEVVANKDEVQQLVDKYKPTPFLIFPENREHSIRLKDYLPYRWIQAGAFKSFTDSADKGEFFTLQLGVYALQDLQNVKVQFTDLKGPRGAAINAKDITCINTTGIAYDGKPLTNIVNVAKDKVQALWCGMQIPTGIPAGIYKGTATVSTDGATSKNVNVSIVVNNKQAFNGNIGEPEKMTRLHWLNSTMAQENTVIAP